MQTPHSHILAHVFIVIADRVSLRDLKFDVQNSLIVTMTMTANIIETTTEKRKRADYLGPNWHIKWYLIILWRHDLIFIAGVPDKYHIRPIINR